VYQRLNSLWIGPALGRIERACLLSAMRQGHPVRLYCYQHVDGVPDGVELRDAAEIVPEGRIIRHRGGSVSLFTNLFRYELQRRGCGTWIDCDAYFVAPLAIERPYLMGWETDEAIAVGVLKLPPDSPMLPPLIDLFDERVIPPWLNKRSKPAAWVRRAMTGRTGLAKMPWGVAGPRAVTAMAKRFGLTGHALPSDVLYPVPWQEADWILDPHRTLEERITPRTISVHLWNERIKGFKDRPAPPGSVLERLQREGADG